MFICFPSFSLSPQLRTCSWPLSILLQTNMTRQACGRKTSLEITSEHVFASWKTLMVHTNTCLLWVVDLEFSTQIFKDVADEITFLLYLRLGGEFLLQNLKIKILKNESRRDEWKVVSYNQKTVIFLHRALGSLNIARFYWNGQQPCKFIGTIRVTREQFNSHTIGLTHQHGLRFIDLRPQNGYHNVMSKRSIPLHTHACRLHFEQRIN